MIYGIWEMRLDMRYMGYEEWDMRRDMIYEI